MTTTHDPYRHLIAALFVRAVRDVRTGSNGHSVDAWRFLTGDWCSQLAELLDVEHDLARLVAELPEPETWQLALMES